jgi:hypothetical protein
MLRPLAGARGYKFNRGTRPRGTKTCCHAGRPITTDPFRTNPPQTVALSRLKLSSAIVRLRLSVFRVCWFREIIRSIRSRLGPSEVVNWISRSSSRIRANVATAASVSSSRVRARSFLDGKLAIVQSYQIRPPATIGQNPIDHLHLNPIERLVRPGGATVQAAHKPPAVGPVNTLPRSCKSNGWQGDWNCLIGHTGRPPG